MLLWQIHRFADAIRAYDIQVRLPKAFTPTANRAEKRPMQKRSGQSVLCGKGVRACQS
ncbi:MAG: hypothetical protein KF832_20635 [Caldilineaceae bacterium]|nr:hypothetical protein [Caldilineaceae bacterium]